MKRFIAVLLALVLLCAAVFTYPGLFARAEEEPQELLVEDRLAVEPEEAEAEPTPESAPEPLSESAPTPEPEATPEPTPTPVPTPTPTPVPVAQA